jgi:hypothetical protein
VFKLPPRLSKQLKGLLEMAIDRFSREEDGEAGPAADPAAETETNDLETGRPESLPPDRPDGAKNYIARRRSWLTRYPWVVGLAFLAIIVIFVAEHNWTTESWVAWRRSISDQWQQGSIFECWLPGADGSLDQVALGTLCIFFSSCLVLSSPSIPT